MDLTRFQSEPHVALSSGIDCAEFLSRFIYLKPQSYVRESTVMGKN